MFDKKLAIIKLKNSSLELYGIMEEREPDY